MNLKNKVTEEELKQIWDNWSKKREGYTVYDNWLDNYESDFKKAKEILDLGCGIGANTAYLLERGYSVLSCDISKEALHNIEKHVPNSKTFYLDITKPFPFSDSSYDVIIADLCIHYFCESDTFHMMKEIKRILKSNGILLARVARVDDYAYGAGEGEELERHYYFEGDYYKRFFDEEDVEKFFQEIGFLEYKKSSFVRDEETYQEPKMVYEIKVVKE